MTPFIRDVSAEAVADGKIHYYFMSTEGFVTSPTAADNIYKWGDSCLIVFPNGETMLVDTGCSSNTFDEISAALKQHEAKTGLSIRIQREDIFHAMHRI